MRLEIEIPGRAVAQGNMKCFGGRAVWSKDLLDWRDVIAGYGKVRLAAYAGQFPVISSGPVSVEMEFYIGRPPKRRNYDLYKPGPSVPDGDKLQRAILDGLTGIAFADDAQVARGVWVKLLTIPPGEDHVRVIVEPWEAPIVALGAAFADAP